MSASDSHARSKSNSSAAVAICVSSLQCRLLCGTLQDLSPSQVPQSHVLQAPAALASILKPLEVLTRPLPVRQRPSDEGAQGEQHDNGQEGQAGRAGAQAGPRTGRSTAAQDQVCLASKGSAAPHQVCLAGRSSAVQDLASLMRATIQLQESKAIIILRTPDLAPRLLWDMPSWSSGVQMPTITSAFREHAG